MNETRNGEQTAANFLGKTFCDARYVIDLEAVSGFFFAAGCFKLPQGFDRAACPLALPPPDTTAGGGGAGAFLSVPCPESSSASTSLVSSRASDVASASGDPSCGRETGRSGPDSVVVRRRHGVATTGSYRPQRLGFLENCPRGLPVLVC